MTGLAGAGAVISTWDGGAGNWDLDTNWSPVGVPDNGVDTYSVLIDTDLLTNSVVSLDMTATIDNLTIDSDDVLNILNTRSLTLVGGVGTGTIANSGLLSLNASNYYTYLKVSGDVTLSGGGTVTLANNSYNRIRGVSATDRLVNVDNLIQGAGAIGYNSMFLTNQGTIEANQTNSLTIDPSSGAGGVINSGTMQATSGATLILSAGSFDNTGGLIQAQDASTVRLSGVTVTGGTLSTGGSGEVRGQGTVTLDDVTNAGVYRIPNASATNLQGTFNNTGTVLLDASSGYTYLRSDGDVTLTGGGIITLSNSTLNRIQGLVATDRLTNVNNLIQGAGQIGYNSMFLTNQGTIEANQTNTLTIDPSSGPGGVINSGTMRATSGATLIFSTGTVDNTGGVIEAQDASTVLLKSNVSITGGDLNVVGAGEFQLSSVTLGGGAFTNSATGVIRVTAGTSTIGGSLTNPLGGQVILDVTSTLILESGGTYANSGTIAMNASYNYTYLKVSNGDVTLSGGGTVTLSNSSLNQIRGLVATDRLINVDNLIQGAGQIGNNSMFLTNQGTIEANQTNTLTIDPTSGPGGVINTGTMRAAGGATLILTGGSFDNTGGVIEAQDASTVRLSGVTITGGDLNVVGAGELQLSSATLAGSALTNSATGVIRTTTGTTNTIGGSLTNPLGGQVILDVSSTLILESGGTYANSGTIAMNASYNYTYLKVSNGDVTLSGGGTVTLSNSSLNHIRGLVATDRLINVDNLIQGAGQIGYNAMFLTNQGTIEANQTNSLTIDPSSGPGGVINSGTMRATSGATLILSTGTVDNTGGVIEAQDASTVLLKSNLSITGGDLNVVGAGELQLDTTTLTGATVTNSATGVIRTTTSTSTIGGSLTNPLGGQIILNSGSILILESGGTYANSGTIAINATGSHTYLKVSGGDVTLTGGGTLTLSNTTLNHVQGVASTDRLINVDNLIQGAGTLGANIMALTNHSTIEANQSNALTIDPSAGGAVNTGTMRAAGGGALILSNGDFDNAVGLIEAQDASTVRLSGATTITGGTLTTSGSGLIRCQGTATLDGVTNAGAYEVQGSHSTLLKGTLNNTGTVSVNSTGGWTYLRPDGDVILTGGGTVTLSNTVLNRIWGVSATDRLINLDNLIQGAGMIGYNSMALTNQATIEANQTNSLTIDPSPGAGGVINTGTMRAASGGTLILQGGTFDNTGGLIEAQDGSTVLFNGTLTITGGMLTSSGSGLIRGQGTATLDGLTHAGAYEVLSSRTTILKGTFNNTGTVSVNSTGGWTYLRPEGGDVTLTGGGTVTLSNRTLNRIVGMAATDRLINQDNTIQGAGQFEVLLTNYATVHASESAGLDLKTYDKINHGTFKASNASTLNVSVDVTGSGRWEADGGTIYIGAVNIWTTGDIDLINGGHLDLNGTTMTGGHLTMDSTSSIDVASSLSVSGNVSYSMTDDAKWSWAATAILEMTGGPGAPIGQWAAWAWLELGGEDLGTDPDNHIGDPAGYVGNFHLENLTLAADARVYLTDLINNGHRGGSFGFSEALYVRHLELGESSILNLNGLHLYYETLVLSGAGTGQIIDQVIPEPATLILLGLGVVGARFRRKQR